MENTPPNFQAAAPVNQAPVNSVPVSPSPRPSKNNGLKIILIILIIIALALGGIVLYNLLHQETTVSDTSTEQIVGSDDSIQSFTSRSESSKLETIGEEYGAIAANTADADDISSFKAKALDYLNTEDVNQNTADVAIMLSKVYRGEGNYEGAASILNDVLAQEGLSSNSTMVLYLELISVYRESEQTDLEKQTIETVIALPDHTMQYQKWEGEGAVKETLEARLTELE